MGSGYRPTRGILHGRYVKVGVRLKHGSTYLGEDLMKKHRQHLSFANVTSILALFVALSGSAYAVGKVGSNGIKREAVKSKHVDDGSLLAEDFAPGQLPAGPQGPPGAPGAPGAPAGAVSFFNLAACPSGWTELTGARGRYLVGVPSGGTLGGTAGTALTNL